METVDLFTFIEEIPYGKLFFCSVSFSCFSLPILFYVLITRRLLLLVGVLFLD